MKRILPLIIGLFYLFTSIGVATTIHFCGNVVSSVSLAFSEEKPCCCGPKEAETKCCSDKVVAFEIPSDDYLPSKTYDLLQVTSALEDVSIIQVNHFLFQQLNTPISVDWLADLPPGKSKRIDLCSLIFYS